MTEIRCRLDEATTERPQPLRLCLYQYR